MTIDEVVQDNVEVGNCEYSSDEIICPYCGYSKNIDIDMWFGDTSIHPYEEGEQEITCPICKHIFILQKQLSWKYETSVKTGE